MSKRRATSDESIVCNTTPPSPRISTCSTLTLPLEKFVIHSSYTRCVRPSDPVNRIGASCTVKSTGVIRSAAKPGALNAKSHKTKMQSPSRKIAFVGALLAAPAVTPPSPLRSAMPVFDAPAPSVFVSLFVASGFSPASRRRSSRAQRFFGRAREFFAAAQIPAPEARQNQRPGTCLTL